MAIAFADQSALTAMAAGTPTALVVDLGFGKTSVGSVVDGRVLRNSSQICAVNCQLLQDLMYEQIEVESEFQGQKLVPRGIYSMK